jgi:hypothetical protein
MKPVIDPRLHSTVLLVPQEVNDQIEKYECPSCKRTNCLKPETLLEGAILRCKAKDNGYWQPCVTNVARCIFCRHPVPVELPRRSRIGHVELYCDESKWDDDRFLILSAVAIHPDILGSMIDKTNAMKSEFFGSQEKIIHATDIWNGNQRRKKYNSALTQDKVVEFFIKWSSLFQEIESRDYLLQFMGIFEKSQLLTITRSCGVSIEGYQFWNVSFLSFCWMLIYLLTQIGFEPDIYFEQAKNDKINVDGRMKNRERWLNLCFVEEQKRLVYPFLTHGLFSGAPMLNKKGETLASEQADMIAYHGRKLFFGNKNEKTMFNAFAMGEVTYFSFLYSGGQHTTDANVIAASLHSLGL